MKLSHLVVALLAVSAASAFAGEGDSPDFRVDAVCRHDAVAAAQAKAEKDFSFNDEKPRVLEVHSVAFSSTEPCPGVHARYSALVEVVDSLQIEYQVDLRIDAAGKCVARRVKRTQ